MKRMQSKFDQLGTYEVKKIHLYQYQYQYIGIKT